MSTIRSEESPQYGLERPENETSADTFAMIDDEVIEMALHIVQRRAREKGEAFTSPGTAKTMATLRLGNLEHEVFGVFFLDTRHRLIEFEEIFRGTVDGASVYPREVVKRALAHNASAVVLTHNHPSGIADPSRSDELLTRRLSEALALVDVKVLDHIVVVSDLSSAVSFAEKGMI